MASCPAVPARVLATARCSAARSVVTASTGSTDAPASWAAVSARSLATSRTMMASGMRNAMATIEVTAADSSAIVFLTAGSPRRVEHHADAAYRTQVAGPGGGLAQLAPQPGDVHVDGLVIAVGLPPYLSEQLLPGYHHTG